MSEQIKVEKVLKFRGAANKMGNVRGNFSFRNEVVLYDDFVGKAIDDTNDYTVTADSSNLATVTAPHNLTLTNNENNEGVVLATAVTFYGQLNPACECRIRMDTIASTHAHFGFIDEATDQPPLTYTTDTISWNATNAVLWFYDKAATTEEWFGASVKGGSTGEALADPSKAPVNGEYVTLRIELRDNGSTTDALFYMNTAGEEINPTKDFVYIEFDAVARAIALCVAVGTEGRDTGGYTVDVDYLKVWSERQ